MKVGYFDCFAGASGDMILACLLDAGFETEALARALEALGLKGIEPAARDVLKKGIRAKSFSFRVGAGRAGSPKRVSGRGASAGTASATGSRFKDGGTHREIVRLLGASRLSPWVKAGSLRAFDLLAEAEARIHGTAKAKVHFHEVGSLDSIVDVVGCFAGLEALGLKRIAASPLALGTGIVECRHGTLPSPAPATLEIARGLPVRGWPVDGELTTPTGAALLRACSSAFGPMPDMVVERVGYGAGTRDLEGVPNIMRLVVGETQDPGPMGLGHDVVTLIETNLDDTTPQLVAAVFDDLFGAGALDVWVETILMKKGRPGFLLSVLAPPAKARALAEIVLSATTTSGVRLTEARRLKLPRRPAAVKTRFGPIKVKVFTVGSRTRCAPEYEDCLRAARARGVLIAEVIEEARHAWLKGRRDAR
ncbi:MAG: nickel pincer cofactor biosynthesis protein LarC [bacterium]